MGARKVLDTRFNLANMGSVNSFLHQKLVLFLGTFWLSVSAFLLPLFRFISIYLFRFKRNDCSESVDEESNNKESNCISPESDLEAEQDITDSENDGMGEKERPKICFQFKFPTYEEFSRSSGKKSAAEVVHEEIPENSTPAVNAEIKFQVDHDEVHFHSENDSSGMDSDSESISSNHQHSVTSSLIDSYSDGFLSDGDFGGVNESDEEEDGDVMKELRKLEETNLKIFGSFQSEFISKKKEFGVNSEKTIDGSDNSAEPNSKNSSNWDSEESKKLETLWEHQELIEQLKMELRKVRATGLPTILEESESPKMMEDLKPWKIDERFQLEDRMDELHKLYRCYRERMRKFDIFNYQKMYAIGFLQLKDPLQSISAQKSPVPVMTSFLSQNLFLWKRRRSETDPTMKFIKELQSDLEVVYVGQMCLSWGILQRQYGGALEMWESDPHGVHRYNEVAGEFQQFQVLLQRFMEDEPFQGPRVQYYVKSRCVLRNLLQVPLIREDSSEERKKAKRREQEGDYAITSDMLIEIIEESIRIFWHFIRTDKDCTNAIVKGKKGTQGSLHDPADSELLMEIKKNLQKNERKLKVLLRRGNCILRKFKKCSQEESSDHVLFFFSQVDMKLVTRVLNMSRITREQLVWCQNKLSKISFVNRKIHVEPSFLLFPC